jgi:hypothetical protein
MKQPTKDELRDTVAAQREHIEEMRKEISALESENEALEESLQMQRGDLSDYVVLIQAGYRRDGGFFFDRYKGDLDDIELTVLRCRRELDAMYITRKSTEEQS